MRRTILTGIISCWTLLAGAQGSYQPGYVVLNSNDTLRGEVEFADWAINPVSIRYRNKETKQQYGVALLKGFGVDGRATYQRFGLSYQQAAADLSEATDSYDGPVKREDAWLRLLYQSKYSLYELATPTRKHYFLLLPSGELKELIYRVRVRNGEMQKDEQYRNLLSLVALETDNAAAAQREIDKATYDEKSLLRVFSALNGGKSNFTDQGKGGTHFDIYAGGVLNTFSTDGSLYNDGSGAYAVYNASFSGTAGFTAGFGKTYISRRNNGRIQARIGAGISSLKLDGVNTTGVGSFRKETYTGNLLLVSPGATVYYLLNPGSPTGILLGPGFGYNLVLSSNFKSRFENPGLVIEKDNFPPADGGFLYYGLNLAVNGKWGRINLAATRGSNIFNAQSTTLIANSFSLTYGYVFGRKEKE